MRASAYTRRTGTVPPLALVVKVARNTDTSTAAALLDPCIIVAALAHPILDRLLLEAGATTDGNTYRVRAPRTTRPAHQVTQALTAVHPTVWRTPGVHRLRHVEDVLGPALCDAMSVAGAAPANGRPRRLAGMSLRLARSGPTLRLTPTADTLDLGGHSLVAGARNQLRLTPPRALTLIRAAQDAGLVVLAANPTDIERLHDLVERSCVVSPVPAAPGWAHLTAGRHVDLAVTGPVTAAQAAQLADDLEDSGTLVAVHASVREVADATRSSAAGRVGLHPWQDAFVSAYLASGPGMVNALPPGTGKTVCAAAAMSERAATTTSYRAVVLAPATLRAQWSAELGVFFPDAAVTVAETSADLAAVAEDWGPCRPRPHVLICTPQLLARVPDAQRLTSDDLVVDEATFLTNPQTKTAAAAWELRSRAAHAMVLTGTPAHRGGTGTGELLAFARNTPDEFTGHDYAVPHPDVGSDRAGILLFTGAEEVSAQLPHAAPTPVVLAAGDAEKFIDKLARERVCALLDQPRPPAIALRTEAAAWRLGLASPAALLASGYALAEQARAVGVPGTVGVKGDWVTERARVEAAAGGQVLVFSDFASALVPLARHLSVAGMSVEVVSSALRTRDRERVVAEFARGGIDVLLVASAGHLGLNLQTAGCVLHLDVPTSASSLRQRTARAARLGSTYATVTVEVPVLDGCADQLLLEVLSEAAADPVAVAWHLCRPGIDRS